MFSLFRQRERVHQLAFSPSGLTLAAAVTLSGGAIDRIRVWDLVEREPVSLLHPPGDVVDLTFVRDDATLIFEQLPLEIICLLDVPTEETRPLFEPGEGAVPFWSAVGEDGESVVAVFATPAEKHVAIDVRQVEVSTRRESLRAQFVVKAHVTGLALRPGKPDLLAVLEQPRRVALLSPGRLAEEVVLPRKAKVDSLAFAPDGRTLALRGSRSLRLWDVDDKRMNAEILGPPTFHTVAFSPDGRTLAIGTSDGVVRFYDVATGQQRAAFDWQVGPVHALTYAPDGMRVAAGGTKGTIVVWDVEG